MQDGHQTGIAAKRADDRSRLKGLLALVLVIIAVGIVVACVAVPTFGFILMMGLVASSYLVLYIGIPLATATWGLFLAYIVFARKEGWQTPWQGYDCGGHFVVLSTHHLGPVNPGSDVDRCGSCGVGPLFAFVRFLDCQIEFVAFFP